LKQGPDCGGLNSKGPGPTGQTHSRSAPRCPRISPFFSDGTGNSNEDKDETTNVWRLFSKTVNELKDSLTMSAAGIDKALASGAVR